MKGGNSIFFKENFSKNIFFRKSFILMRNGEKSNFKKISFFVGTTSGTNGWCWYHPFRQPWNVNLDFKNFLNTDLLASELLASGKKKC